MRRRNLWLPLSIVASVACGARSELEGLDIGASRGGNASTGGAVSAGGAMMTACTLGQSRCITGSTSFQTCESSAQWGPPIACGGATPFCIADTCVACPGTGGPSMVLLPLGYCIDSTEVTEGQYQAWLNTNPSTANQPSVCSWNMDFTPSGNWPPTNNALYDEFDQPVTYVDWCDAYAYCSGVSKRLCGKIGGGSNGFSDYATARLSQWYAACTSNGTNAYPYGNTYEPMACNGYESGVGSILPVGTMQSCQSSVAGYTGIYDMSGNVWELEDSCSGTTGQLDSCHVRGGAFDNGTGSLECGLGNNDARSYANDIMGFRCCAP